MPLRERGVGVAGEDHLALLGDLQPAIDRAGRLGRDRTVKRATATSEGSPSAVEEGELHVGAVRPLDQLALRAGQVEGRTGRADVLRGVRVAEHDLHGATVGQQPLLGAAQREPRVQRRDGGIEVGSGLEQRDDIEAQRRVADGQASEGAHGGQVRRALGEGDDVGTAAAGAPALLEPGHHPEGVEHLAGAVVARLDEGGPAVGGQAVQEGRVIGKGRRPRPPRAAGRSGR